MSKRRFDDKNSKKVPSGEPMIVFRRLRSTRNDECPITMKDFQNGQIAWQSPSSGHLYDPVAAYKWLQCNGWSDPLTRERLDYTANGLADWMEVHRPSEKADADNQNDQSYMLHMTFIKLLLARYRTRDTEGTVTVQFVACILYTASLFRRDEVTIPRRLNAIEKNTMLESVQFNTHGAQLLVEKILAAYYIPRSDIALTCPDVMYEATGLIRDIAEWSIRECVDFDNMLRGLDRPVPASWS